MDRYPKALRKMAVERLKSCDNIVALFQGLVHRRLFYKGRDQLETIKTARDHRQLPERERA
jgi:hypothetical protein